MSELVAEDLVERVPPDIAPLPGHSPAATVTKRRPRRRNVLVVAAVSWLLLVVVGAILADLLPLHRYDLLVDDLAPRTAPRWSVHEPLGTDGIGRSVLSRLVYGARQSLVAATAATGLALLVGLALGTLAGYFRGVLDEVIGVFVESLLAIPGIVLLLAIAAVGQRSMSTLVFGLVVIGIPGFTRLARANTIAIADREFVSAAVAMGASHRRVLVREIVPTVLVRLSTFAVLFLSVVIVIEAGLSFLGLGVPPPNPSWGGMVSESRPQLATEPQLVFIPAACIVLTVAAFQIVGDWARRRFESRRSGSL